MRSDIETAVVPFFDYRAIYRDRGTNLLDVVRDVLERGAFILQQDVTEFEVSLGAYLGRGEVIGVGNCTDGLELILRAIGVEAGDEVIVPAHTFVATAGAVRAVDAVPRFAEVGPDHDLDPSELDRLASQKTRAVMPVSLNGRCAELEAIVEIASRHGWAVVEDAAQAVGARLNGRSAGTFGDAGAFSFYPAKTLGAIGDAGAIVTTDALLAERLRRYRDHGRTSSGAVETWGRNSRLDNLQAAVLLAQLRRYEADVEIRRAIYSRYANELSGIPSLRFTALDANGRFDVCQNCEIEAEERDGLRTELARRGIGTALPWGGRAVTDFECLETEDQTPRTSELMKHLLLLPLHQYLGDSDVDRVIEAVLAARG